MVHTPRQEHKNLEQSLIEIGLSIKEAGVYIALLTLGHGTVSQISRRANINRTTGYDILDSLSTKWLVSISGKEPKQEYTAETPENLSKFINQEINIQQEALKRIQEIIPELKSIHNIKDRPKVFFYEGREGLEKVYEDTLTSTETIRAYANLEYMNLGLPGYFPGYFKRRAGRGIFIRAIGPKTEDNLELAKRNVEEKRETALVPKNKCDFSPEINIYDNKVMIASWKEKLGIIIESSEISDAMKIIFELAWAEAKRLDKELEKI